LANRSNYYPRTLRL